MDTTLTRRGAMTVMAGAAGAVLAAGEAKAQEAGPLKGRLKQSVCAWCYAKVPLPELAKHAKRIGLKSVELLGEADWPIVQAEGLTCAMANGPSGIGRGWNRPQDHDDLVKKSEDLLPKVKAAGLPNMIVFSGNREGLPDDEGIRNCAKGLKRITPLAEKLGVTVCMELLNSKKDHKDYQCDHTEWGAALVEEVASERFKLLYDIYHMQIMEGDVIATITKHFDKIAHYHTGGVPGRHEIDKGQELFYPRVCEAILELGFTGYLAQEF
ncbi:MAG: TIM barrel protein, partial [Candidatus Hydrogenedentota bacterium]